MALRASRRSKREHGSFRGSVRDDGRRAFARGAAIWLRSFAQKPTRRDRLEIHGPCGSDGTFFEGRRFWLVLGRMDGEVVVRKYVASHEAELGVNYLREHEIRARV